MQIQDHDEFPKFDHRVLPPASRRSLGDSARPPTIPGMPGIVGSHENWGKFKCHKWGELLRHSHLILWDEYVAANPGGYSYSRFCELYRAFERTLSVTMRQTHAAGERLFVDYAGDGVPVVIDRLTGEIRMAQIFVAVLGASSFTFAKATWTQALPDSRRPAKARLTRSPSSTKQWAGTGCSPLSHRSTRLPNSPAGTCSSRRLSGTPQFGASRRPSW